MFKRIGLFLLMNILVNAVFVLILFWIEYFFWIRLLGNNTSYTVIAISSLIFWFTGAFISLFLSKWLAKKTYWIEIISYENMDLDNANEKFILDTIWGFAERYSIKTPEFGVYQNEEANAFTVWTGKNNALISFSTWLINSLKKEEIEWIIAHEIASLNNWDMLTMALMQWIVNAFIVFFARIVSNAIDEFVDGGLWAIAYMVINIWLQVVFWILATPLLMKFAHYRTKKADITAAEMIWKDKIILSLNALKNEDYFDDKEDWVFDSMKIRWKKSMFSTHPDLDDRIKALEELKI
jgi:heat shock protein HtpX